MSGTNGVGPSLPCRRIVAPGRVLTDGQPMGKIALLMTSGQRRLPDFSPKHEFDLDLVAGHLPRGSRLDQRDILLLGQVEAVGMELARFDSMTDESPLFGVLASLFLPPDKDSSKKIIWDIAEQRKIEPRSLEIELLDDKSHHRLVYRVALIGEKESQRFDFVVSLSKGELTVQSISDCQNLKTFCRQTRTVSRPFYLSQIVSPQRVVFIREYINGNSLERKWLEPEADRAALASALGYMLAEFYEVSGGLPDHLNPHNVIIVKKGEQLSARLSEVACLVLISRPEEFLRRIQVAFGRGLHGQTAPFMAAFRQKLGVSLFAPFAPVAEGLTFGEPEPRGRLIT